MRKNTDFDYLLRFEYKGKLIAKATVGIEKCLIRIENKGGDSVVYSYKRILQIIPVFPFYYRRSRVDLFYQ